MAEIDPLDTTIEPGRSSPTPERVRRHLDRVLICGAGTRRHVRGAVARAHRGASRSQCVEKGDDLARPSRRASTFHPPTLELLDQIWTMADEVIEHGPHSLRTTQFRDRQTGPDRHVRPRRTVRSDQVPVPNPTRTEQARSRWCWQPFGGGPRLAGRVGRRRPVRVTAPIGVESVRGIEANGCRDG